MKIFFLTSALLIVLSSCQAPKTNPAKGSDPFLLESQFKDFVPISPLEFDQEVEIFDVTTRTFIMKRIKELAADRQSIIKLLPNEIVYTAVQKVGAGGEIKYGPASVTAEAGTYNVVMDYSKCTTLKVTKDGNNCAGWAKVGVGLRIRASVTTFEANMDISSLFALGVAARTNKLIGQLSVDVIGMESPSITDLIVLPVDISEASIQSALQSMAAIKTKIYEGNANLFPQVIAIKKSSTETCSVMDIINDIKPAGNNTMLLQN